MENNMIKLDMFEAVCKCGHVGREHYVEVHFPIMALSRKEAARIARGIPRVKHNHKDAVLDVIKIDKERFDELRRINNHDQYLHCKNIQDQNVLDISYRLIEERRSNFRLTCKDGSGKHFYCSKQELRNPKKYMNRYYDNDVCA